MKTRKLLPVAAAAMAGLLVFSIGGFAAGPSDGGSAGSGYGGGGGSGSGSGSGEGGGGGEPPDYGDLFVLYRDADGVPILTADFCQQPIGLPSATCPLVCEEGAPCLVPVDPATCGIQAGFEACTQEVEFGRTNVARSPERVFATQMEDVLVRLSTADCVTRDAAGRMVTSTVTDGLVTSAAIDSPIQNLAIYQQLMLNGYLGTAEAPFALPGDVLDIAAVGIGAASDKGGKVSVDMVIYLNQILGLTDESVPTFLPKKCIEVKEEVMGTVQMVRKCFLDYGPTGANHLYSRGAHFGALPAPAYIPAVAPQAGWFEYLNTLEPTMPTFGIGQGPTLGVVPELTGNPSWMGSNIESFAQAADDARAVINFMHSWPVPGDYPTPFTCGDSGAITYDVSISEMSGLQVPVRMVAGTEGREFTLSVANAGPGAALGTVVLTAVDANGIAIPTFPRSYDFTLAAGATQSWTEGFSVSYKTTIAWTATAHARFDVNPANNSVTETTIVKKGGGNLVSKPKTTVVTKK
ncbi:MAG TPA: hypothetical protein VIR60_10635 [Gammaproteobacteria bacterium]